MLRWLKNILGSYQGFGGCPNCGDSWWWRKSGNITYMREGNASMGVMICKECLAHPEAIDRKKVLQDLADHGWDENTLKLVEPALANYANCAGCRDTA